MHIDSIAFPHLRSSCSVPKHQPHSHVTFTQLSSKVFIELSYIYHLRPSYQVEGTVSNTINRGLRDRPTYISTLLRRIFTCFTKACGDSSSSNLTQHSSDCLGSRSRRQERRREEEERDRRCRRLKAESRLCVDKVTGG